MAMNWAQLVKDAENGPKFDVIPNGDYNFKVTEADVKTTRNGETMFALKCTIETGPHAKRVLFHNLTVPGATAEKGEARAAYFLNDLKAMGFTQGFIDAQPTEVQMRDAFVGKTFIGVVNQREYPVGSGTMRNNINRVKKAPAGLAAAGVGGATPPPPPGAAPQFAPPQAAPQQQQQQQAPQPPQPQYAPATPQPQAQAPQPQYAPAPPAPVEQAPQPQYAQAAPQQQAPQEVQQPQAAPQQYAPPSPVPTPDAPPLPDSPFGPQ